LCGLGKTAPNPVLSTIKYFRDEYEAHIRNKKCPAAVCKELLTYSVLEEFCNGCSACKRICPADAITGKRKQVHKIVPDLCIKCGTCFEVCKFKAIMKW
jgi:Na+-translocating ferredoxin:NAD+ oxidoreductase RNF subunit RnfB